MKYVIILPDGCADEPLSELNGMTPMEYANTPNMDMLAGKGEMGMVKTVPDGMKPGSDVANLSVIGYDPRKSYSGRSPLEALSVGVQMAEDDAIYRCNLVTLTEDAPYEQKTILDHSAGEITTQEADILMDAVREVFNSEEFQFYTGTSYRHITVWKHGKVLDMAQPHDHLGQTIGQYLPQEKAFRDMMERSFDILNNHPINVARAAEGKNKANSLWFWGAGTKPSLQNFKEKTGLSGTMISAVDLLKGIALGAGMNSVDVPGATGGLETNYKGKADAAIKALLEDGSDFAYIHIEAPDEMGHQGSVAKKVKAMENIDAMIVGPVVQTLDASGESYRILILPDHPTPIRCRTHTGDPVPYILFDSTCQRKAVAHFNEKEAAATGNYVAEGCQMINKLIGIGGK